MPNVCTNLKVRNYLCMAHLESVTTQKNISVKCKILLKNILSYLFLIRYLKFMLKRRTASAGFFSQSGTIKEDNLFDEEQVEQFKANYTRSMGKFIDYSIDSLQQAIQDQNTIGIAYEAIGRLMLTLFSQMLYTAFPEEGNTLINEIRYYSSAAKAKEPRGHEFEILTHDEAAELAKGGKLQTEKKQDPKVRIVQNEGNRIKKVIDALKAINKIISLVNDRDDDVEIQPKIMEYNEKYNTKIKIRELEKELEDRYNGNVSLQVMMQYVEQQSGDLDYVRYHIAKHLYDAFDFKPLEEKVLVPANESDKKVQSIRLINVLPSAEGSRKAAYHVKDGAEYRKDQINSAIGYNDKVVFREKDLNPSLLSHFGRKTPHLQCVVST